MAFTIFRLVRFLRSIFAPLAAVICFSCLLTFVFILYQPNSGPGHIQRVGWQSWEVVSPPIVAQDGSTSPKSNSSTKPSVPEGVDWWNVTSGDENVDTASLPLDVWAPLLPHDTGLSEIAITRCMFNPSMGDICSPKTTSEQDAIKGNWVRVDRNLNSRVGIWYLSLYYRRTRRLDIPLISEIRLLPDNTSPTPLSESWHKVSRSIRDGVMGQPALFLWYRTGKTLLEMTPQERQEDLITELDVLFGDDKPWFGFEKLEPAATVEKAGRYDSVWVTYRKGVKSPPRAPPLHFSREGKFKILQVADLHYSVSHGVCLDTQISPCTHADNMTSTLLGHILDEEKPDLVVFTGDQMNGAGKSWDPKSVLAKFALAATDRKIPWAAVFGTHDQDDGVSKEDQMRLMQALPYSVVVRGPKDVHGVGNYVLKVKSADPSKTHLLTLYFLDSGTYSKGYLDWFGFFTPTAYDWIHEDQVNWFLQESNLVNAIERPFRPDTAKDLSGVWKRQFDQVTQTTRLAKPNALMFFHSPLQETYNNADVDTLSGQTLDVGIHGNEPSKAAKTNGGLFEKGILTAMESNNRAAGNVREVKVIANGHAHITDNCRRVRGVWLCFGGGGSYSGYGRVGFDRRFRIYDISDYGETIRTYKRTEKDVVLDDMILAGRGAPSYQGT